MHIRSLILFTTLLISSAIFAQEKATVFGRVTNQRGKAVELANVAISGVPGGTTTDKKGY